MRFVSTCPFICHALNYSPFPSYHPEHRRTLSLFTSPCESEVLPLYKRSQPPQPVVIDQHIHLDPEIFGSADPRLVVMGKRAGIRASFCFACVTLASALTIPFIASQSSSSLPRSGGGKAATSRSLRRLSVGRAWLIAHCLFATLMFLTTFVHTAPAATVIVAALGLSWGVASWAPYTLIGAEIVGLQADAAVQQERQQQRHLISSSPSKGAKELQGSVGSDDGGMRRSSDEENRGSEEDGDEYADLHTATIMAVHNMAISIPQICAALTCSALYKVVEAAGRDDPAAYAFKLAGVAAVLAAWVGRNLK